MLDLSDIKSSQEELQDYYAQLRGQHATPAWIGGGISIEPRSKAVPYLWRWRDLRPQAMRAAQLVGTQQAEHRVLRLTTDGNTENPTYGPRSKSQNTKAKCEGTLTDEPSINFSMSDVSCSRIDSVCSGWSGENRTVEDAPLLPGGSHKRDLGFPNIEMGRTRPL
jgi:hypothetical protein